MKASPRAVAKDLANPSYLPSRIIASGTPDEIIRAHGRPARLRVEGPPELAGALKKELGLEARFESGHVEVDLGDKQDALRVLSAIERSGIAWDSFTTQSDTLEDVFVRLVGQMDEGALKSEAPT